MKFDKTKRLWDYLEEREEDVFAEIERSLKESEQMAKVNKKGSNGITLRTFFCSKCNFRHAFNTDAGRKHLKYAVDE